MENYLNIIGLSLDIFGVIGLFLFGVPNKELNKGVMHLMSYNKTKEDKDRIYSAIALGTIVIGFILQISASVYGLMFSNVCTA